MITEFTGVGNIEVDPSLEWIEVLISVPEGITDDEIAALHKRQAKVTVTLCR